MGPRWYIVVALAGCAADAPNLQHFAGCLDACEPGQVAEVWAYADGGRRFSLGDDGALVAVHDREIDWLDGELAVAAHATFPSANAGEGAKALALASDGGSLVETEWIAQYGAAALHALDADGAERWQTTTGAALAIVALPARDYVGSTYGDAEIGGRALVAPFVAGLDASSGAIAWVFTPPAAPAGLDRTRTAIAALPDGGVVAGTQFTGGFDAGAVHLDAPAGGAALVVALSADGAPRWATQIAGSSNVPLIRAVAAGPGGEIAVEFVAQGSADVAGQHVELPLANHALALFGGDGALRFVVAAPPAIYGSGVTLATDGTTIYAAVVGDDNSHVAAFTAAGQRWDVVAGGEGDQAARIVGLGADGLYVQIDSQYDPGSEQGDPAPQLDLSGLKLHQRLALARFGR